MNLIKLSFLFLVATAFSQKEVSGKIVDSETGRPLAYVNIGIRNKSVGTVSDSEGNFKFKLSENVNEGDSVVFSHIGFIKQIKKLSNLLTKESVIQMQSKTTDLDEVVIKFKAPKAKKIGRKRKGIGLMHANFYSASENSVNDRLSKEMGMRLPIRKDCKVGALNFNITSNDFKSLKFRVNLYTVENNLPGELLNNKDIIFEIEDNQLGWFSVDLTDSDIYLESDLEEVIVTIQWLESKRTDNDSKFFSISTAIATSKNFFYREKGMDKWINGKSKLSFYLDAKCK